MNCSACSSVYTPRTLEGAPRVELSDPKSFFKKMDEAGGPVNTYVTNFQLTSEEVLDLNTISRVQELADERGLTLCQLSKICDLSEATIRTAKKRGNQLSVDTIERICEALDISLSDFFAETLPK